MASERGSSRTASDEGGSIIRNGSPSSRSTETCRILAEVAPDRVISDESGDPYTVRYEQLVPLLLNEVQELRASNDDLLERLEALEAEVAALK